MFKLILFVILVVVLCLFWFKDNSLKQNISALWSILIIAILIIVIILIGSSIIKQLKSNGIGSLFTDMLSMGSVSPKTEENIVSDTIFVEVKQTDIIIDDITYSDVTDAVAVIRTAADQGVEKVHIIDNYALTNTYEDLIDLLDANDLISDYEIIQ